MLVKLGVTCLTLIDPDEVDSVNLGVQGFYEAETGMPKVQAVLGRLRAIDSEVRVQTHVAEYEPGQVHSESAVFVCVDSIRVRRRIFRDYRCSNWAVLFDGRMAAESLQVFCVERNPQAMEDYERTLFPSHEVYRQSCTARATIYCASMAAAILCAQYKRWAMKQEPEASLQFDLLSMDVYR